MTAKRFRVNELVKYNYSEIGEYTDENHTDRPLMNGEVVELLNGLHEENQSLKFDNKELIRFITSKGYTLQDYIEFIGQFQSVGVNKRDWE